MLQKFEIQGIHTVVDDNLHKYITKKIGKLDRYLSSHDRESVHAEAFLKETKSKGGNLCVCEVIIYLPHDTIVIKESTLNMYAAIDIVETKLKQQLKKHKDKRGSGKLHRRLAARFSRTGITPENIA